MKLKPIVVVLPLAGIVAIALLAGLAEKAPTKRILPPTGSAQPQVALSASPPISPKPALHPKPAPSPWKRLSVKDLEQAMEERDDPEEILRFLRSRAETYLRDTRPPLPPLTPPASPVPAPAPAPQGAPQTRPLPAAAPAEAFREPTIREVQKAAIRYAEVMPEKIRGWRVLAQVRNLIPRFTVSLDRDTDSTITSSTTQGVTRFAVGPKRSSYSLDYGLTWDFANLLWDSAQTSIDTRSRLMVQLRQDTLEEVTRLYFERLRLQAEFQANPTDDPVLIRERSLRIEELTAQLDAHTGGLYSDFPQKETVLHKPSRHIRPFRAAVP